MTYQDIIATVRSSIYDPGFYVRAKSHPLSTPITTLSVLGIFAIGVTLIVAYSGLVRFAFTDFLNQALATYPEELAITLAHGELSINQPQPYYIKSPLPKDFAGTSTPENLVVFDTDNTLTDDPHALSTFIIAKKTYFVSQDGTPGKSQVTQYDASTATSTLTKTDVAGFVDSVRPYFKPAIIGGGLLLTVVGVLVGTFFWILFHMIYVLIPALMIWIFTLVRSPAYTYSESYVIALYASIPVSIGSFILTSIGIPLPFFGYTILLLLTAIINLTQSVTPGAAPANQ